MGKQIGLLCDESHRLSRLVYALGGGSFEATVLRCSRIPVLTADCDAEISGRRIDAGIGELMCDEFMCAGQLKSMPKPKQQAQDHEGGRGRQRGEDDREPPRVGRGAPGRYGRKRAGLKQLLQRPLIGQVIVQTDEFVKVRLAHEPFKLQSLTRCIKRNLRGQLDGKIETCGEPI
jgi:hypothetical protein